MKSMTVMGTSHEIMHGHTLLKDIKNGSINNGVMYTN